MQKKPPGAVVGDMDAGEIPEKFPEFQLLSKEKYIKTFAYYQNTPEFTVKLQNP